jgi:hypothetical protein
MADSLQPPEATEPALAERIRRLEEQLAARDEFPTGDEAVANRVLRILAEKAAQNRALANGQPPVPGLISTAMTAARVIFPHSPPGAVPQPAEHGFKAWLLAQVAGEFRLMVKMYVDPRYRLSRFGQFGVPLVVALMVLNYFFIAAMPFVGFLVERLVLIVLAVVLYKLLAREAVRYKAVLEYLAQYGYG